MDREIKTSCMDDYLPELEDLSQKVAGSDQGSGKNFSREIAPLMFIWTSSCYARLSFYEWLM